METIDDETSAAAIDYMKRQHASGKPFFFWFNSTRMHLRTHVRLEHRGRYKHGDSEYIDGMIEHDDTIGTLLKALDDMGIANNTIVVYTSDNGPHMNTWPDGAITSFRWEKNTNWEGAFRVPCLVRWPGVIKPGTVTNELMSHNDWFPTLSTIAGEPDIVNKLLKGYQANGKTYKVQLDGYDQSTFLRNVSGTAQAALRWPIVMTWILSLRNMHVPVWPTPTGGLSQRGKCALSLLTHMSDMSVLMGSRMSSGK